MMIASVLACALFAAPALADTGVSRDDMRMRRPRGDRPADPTRARRARRARGARPADPPRMRNDGMYGGYGGMYGDMTDMGCNNTIFKVGKGFPELNSIGEAIEAAGMTPLIQDPNADLTALAPTQSAFDAIDEETLTALLAAPELLAPILQLHIFPGGVLSTDLTDGMVVTTLSGGELTVGVSEDGVTFTSPGGVVASVIQADIVACKSVIHIIDALLMP